MLQLFWMVYCPDFPFNIVFFQRLKKKGIDWFYRYRIFIVSRNTESLGYIKKVYRQYILKYRTVLETYIATVITAGIQRPSKRLSGRQSKDIKASAQALMNLQYKRLDYIGSLTLFKVGKTFLRVRLKGLSTAKYRDCILSKIYQQVSYCPDLNKFIRLFQRVYIDWFDLKKG